MFLADGVNNGGGDWVGLVAPLVIIGVTITTIFLRAVSRDD